jgi:hypothetical protein
MKLRPLTFLYKPEYDKGTRTLQYGPMGKRGGSDDSGRVVGNAKVIRKRFASWSRNRLRGDRSGSGAD